MDTKFIKRLLVTIIVIFLLFLFNLMCWNAAYDSRLNEIRSQYEQCTQEYEILHEQVQQELDVNILELKGGN